jgi:hypothetical protein
MVVMATLKSFPLYAFCCPQHCSLISQHKGLFASKILYQYSSREQNYLGTGGEYWELGWRGERNSWREM